MGGVWERLIRSTKNILRKILREQIVNDEVLMTVFTEVERILNDRPLTKVSTDPRDEDVLTPNMLLLLKKNECDPAGQFDANEDYTRRSWRQSQHLSNTFWKRWMRQYIRLQTTQPTSGGAVTADKNCCANCVEPSRPQQWGPDLPFFGHAGHADPLDGWRCCSQKRVMSRPIQVRQH